MAKFLMASNPGRLREALVGLNSATVEAEYGDDCVEGSTLTFAHHGPRAGNPAPCEHGDVPEEVRDRIEVVGLSHLDLDALGGCMAIMGIKGDQHESFWRLAAFVDVNGPHKLDDSGASAEDLDRLYAFWAWKALPENRVFSPRDGSPEDVTNQVHNWSEALREILDGRQDLIDAGRKFRDDEEALNASSFRRVVQAGRYRVVVRVSEQFTNMLYKTPDNNLAKSAPAERVVCDAVIAHGVAPDRNRSITISVADPLPGFSCQQFVRALWGPEAGGHAGIAGGPRDSDMDEEDFSAAVGALSLKLSNLPAPPKEPDAKPKPAVMGGKKGKRR